MKRFSLLAVILLVCLLPLACSQTYNFTPVAVTPTPVVTPTSTPAYTNCTPTPMYYPNPTSGQPVSANISYPGPTVMRAEVYDSTNSNIYSQAYVINGNVTIQWDLHNQAGTPVPTGTYVIDVTLYGAASTICYYDTVVYN